MPTPPASPSSPARPDRRPLRRLPRRLPRRIGRRVAVRRLTAIAIAVSTTAAMGVLSTGRAAAVTPVATHTVTITTDRDSFVSTTWLHSNFGAMTHVTAGSSYGNIRRTYLHFFRPMGTVLSAQLVLHRAGAWTPSTLTASAAAPTPWSEHTITNTNAPPSVRWINVGYVRSTSWTAIIDVTSEFATHQSSTLVIGGQYGRLVQFASREAWVGQPQLRLVMQNAPTPPPAPAPCPVSTMLVPSCGRWWGSALAFQVEPLADKVAREEAVSGRHDDIVHTYHVNNDLFPTPEEKAVALQPGHNRLLLINWKPATDMTWAAVAAGGADARIDRLAQYIDATFPYRFFLTIYHEPEDNVNPTPGSGMTAADYAAMYRHTVLRLRADGVTNAVTVMNYMGFVNWATQSWFSQLWPGDDVVDWIGLDPYGTGAATGWSAHDFTTLVNRPTTGFPGYYSWATSVHAGKPIMLCEWGVRFDPANPTGQAGFFSRMDSQLASYPAIKGLVYFDIPSPAPSGQPLTDVTVNPTAHAAYQATAHLTPFVGPTWSYAS